MRTIAFVTSIAHKDLSASDLIAAESLHIEGIEVVPAIWDDVSVVWTVFDAVIVRSPWDYHLHPARFRDWIDLLEKQQVSVWNPTDVLRWNMDKRYLRDLEKIGIPIPRTYFFDGIEPFHAPEVRSFLGTDEVVMKPVVSASAWNTWRCSLNKFSDEDLKRMKDIPGDVSIMAQEFMPEIMTEGEWSLIFFGNRFSHAVRKYPGEGDFRVQDELGGRYCSEPNPPENLIRQARDVIAAVERPLLYARVDGIVRSGTLVVMELELLEPSLFFDVAPMAAENFTEKVKKMLSM